MQTVLSLLAATAVLAASAHAGAVPQDALQDRAQNAPHELGPPLREDGRSNQPAPEADTLAPRFDDDRPDGIVFAMPAPFKGFHGVDLSAASPAGVNTHRLVSGIAGDAPYPVRHIPYRNGRASLPGASAGSDGEGVPEPGTLAILSVGLAGLVIASRKKA